MSDVEDLLLEFARADDGLKRKRPVADDYFSDSDGTDSESELTHEIEKLLESKNDPDNIKRWNSMSLIQREAEMAKLDDQILTLRNRLQVKLKAKERTRKKPSKQENALNQLKKSRQAITEKRETTPEKEQERITLEQMSQALVTRDQLEKWCYYPVFDELIVGAYVRLGLGADERGQRVYRLCKITNVSEYRKPYLIGSTAVKKSLELQHGKAKKEFTMETVSNSKLNPQELDRFFKVCVTEKQKLPNINQIEKKIKELNQLKEYFVKPSELDEIIQEKQRLKMEMGKVSSYDLSHKQRELQNERDVAISLNDQVKLEQIQEELQQIQAEVAEMQQKKTSQKAYAIAKLNERNRRINKQEARDAEIIALSQKKLMTDQKVSFSDKKALNLKRKQSLFRNFDLDLYESLDQVLDQFASLKDKLDF